MRLLALIIALAAFFWIPAVAESQDQLLKVVVLSRHGVRAPTQSKQVLESWSQLPWPSWPVERGELTPRGAKLISAMWANLRPGFEEAGIFEAGMCPRPDSIYIRADVDERTKATAKAILEGVAPDCGLKYRAAEGKVDPLFHPVKAGLYRYDAISAASEILAGTRGGFERLQDEFSGAIRILEDISGAPAANLCARFALMPECELSDLPNALSISPDGSNIRVVGSLGIASSMAELFLLEYGEWPGEAAGWGEVNIRVLGQLLPVHSRIFDLVNRAPVVAWANGSALLTEMAHALLGEHPDKAVNDARLVIFVGHDTNIANVGGLLGFFWQASGYPPNGIPPGGAVFLELWEKGGKKEVAARFYSQPPAALHARFVEDDIANHAPKMAYIYGDPVDAPVVMPPESLKALVAKATDGAPRAPEDQKLRELAE